MQKEDTAEIRVEPLRDQVQESLLALVLRGQLHPGERINESRVSDWLGVSRTPLREALIGLTRDGYLEARRNRGFFVAPLSPEDASSLYELLGLLESSAARSLGAPAPAAVTDLGRLDRRLAAAVSPPQALELDFHWHERLLEGCANPHLVRMSGDLRRKVLRYEYACLDPVPDRVGVHGEILRHLAAGAGVEAGAALEDHWRAGRDAVLEALATPAAG